MIVTDTGDVFASASASFLMISTAMSLNAR